MMAVRALPYRHGRPEPACASVVGSDPAGEPGRVGAAPRGALEDPESRVVAGRDEQSVRSFSGLRALPAVWTILEIRGPAPCELQPCYLGLPVPAPRFGLPFVNCAMEHVVNGHTLPNFLETALEP